MIVVVAHIDFSLYWPVRLRCLARRAQERGAALHIVEVSAAGSPYDFGLNGDGPAEASLPVTTLFPGQDVRSLRPGVVARKLWETLESIRPDVVLSGPIAFTPGATCLRWCRANRRGIVVMDDARTEDAPRGWLVNAVKRRMFANVDAVFIPAPSHLPTYRALGMSDHRVFYGVDVVDNDWFAQRSGNGDGCGAVRGVPLPKRFFLGIGRQVPKKNWKSLIDAYARLRAKTAEGAWDLVLVGDGPDRAALEQQVAASKAPGVIFLPFLNPREVASLYAAAAAVVLPSLYGETWGLVINEALACGKPVLVSSEVGSAQTLVRDGENGWTFPPLDVDAMASAMGRMMAADEQTLAGMGEKSRAIISEWGLDRFADGAWTAIASCNGVRRSFDYSIDRLLLTMWKGRYRPS